MILSIFVNHLRCRGPHQELKIDDKWQDQIEIRDRDSAGVHNKSAGAMLALMAVRYRLLILVSGRLPSDCWRRVMVGTAVPDLVRRFSMSTASAVGQGCGIHAGGNLCFMVTGTRVSMVPAAAEDAVDQHHGEHQSLSHPQHGDTFRKTIDL